MRKKNGFTLVELLAVIVVLALIMIIAIPAVLKTMTDSRRKLFIEYAGKVLIAAETQYVSDSSTGAIAGAGYYLYDIQSDLGLQSVGSYRGYIVVDASNVDNVDYRIFLYDNNYECLNVSFKYLDQLESYVKTLGTSSAGVPKSAKEACTRAGATECYNHDGYKIS